MSIEFARQFGYHAAYQEEAKDGEQGGGGGAADRGDDFVEPDGDAAAKEAAEKKAADEKAAAEKKEADDKAAREAEEKRVAEKKERDAKVSIPKDRFDEAVGKERARAEAAEKARAELEEKLAAHAKGADVAKLQKEISDLEDALEAKMAEGTPAERKAIREQIRAKQDLLVDARVNARALEATAVAIEQGNYNTEVARLESKYPFLNVDLKDEFDQDLADEVMDLKGAYEAAGLGSTAALQKAVKTLGHKLDAKAGEAKAAAEKADAEAKEKEAQAAKVKKAEEDAAKAAEEKAKAEEEKRRAAAVEKGQQAKKDSAPGTSGQGEVKTGERDVKKMSDSEFDKLDDAEKKRLRGD